MRSSREVGLLDEEETILALHMVNDRNLTTHTYNVELADELFQKIPGYSRLMRLWWENMKKSIPQ
ncbi:nucleotidyltransferase substrate binding protein [Bacillus sp. FJAT-44742]|uniref:nucleotidyltransferase substrate binding protein n=1 Tax=Bacillus sp. FJAT-44742 TaxID=2014005 RepID=UPI0018E1EED3